MGQAKLFTGKAVYVQEGLIGWTKGKIYEFEDGHTTDDDGTRRPMTDEIDLNKWFQRRFKEVRE